MEKVVRTLLFFAILGACAYAGLFFLASKGMIALNVVPYARTFYVGQVDIEPVILSDIEHQLKATNIHHVVREGAIEIFPRGPGFGPVSFILTMDSLKTEKDIPGTPESEKYKEEVRKDVQVLGGLLILKEDTWDITKTRYPWTAMY